MDKTATRVAHVRNLLIEALDNAEQLVRNEQAAEMARAAQMLDQQRDAVPEPPPLPTEQRMHEYFKQVLEAVQRAHTAGQPVASPVYIDPEMLRAYHHYAAQKLVVQLASGAVTLAAAPAGYALATSFDAEVLRGAIARPGFVTPD